VEFYQKMKELFYKIATFLMLTSLVNYSVMM